MDYKIRFGGFFYGSKGERKRWGHCPRLVLREGVFATSGHGTLILARPKPSHGFQVRERQMQMLWQLKSGNPAKDKIQADQ